MKTAILLGALALAGPLVPATAMAQDQGTVEVAPAPQGQWVQLSDGSWIFVPADASTYVSDGVPYVYLYMPSYGWNWYASPWGAGPFVRGGAWRLHPWPYGFRTGSGHAYGGGHFSGGAHHTGGGHFSGGAHQTGGGHGGGGHGGGGHGGHR